MATFRELLGEAYKDGMTVEELENAISTMKLADLSSGEYVSKGKLSDYERRMKEAEKKLAEKLTDEEKAQAELAKREEYYKALEKENAMHKYTSKLGKTIKDEAVLKEIAGLYADGDFAKAIDKQNEYLAKQYSEMEKNIKADLLKANPTPTPDSGKSGAITQEKFNAMGVQERSKLLNENPELYKQLASN